MMVSVKHNHICVYHEITTNTFVTVVLQTAACCMQCVLKDEANIVLFSISGRPSLNAALWWCIALLNGSIHPMEAFGLQH